MRIFYGIKIITFINIIWHQKIVNYELFYLNIIYDIPKFQKP